MWRAAALTWFLSSPPGGADAEQHGVPAGRLRRQAAGAAARGESARGRVALRVRADESAPGGSEWRHLANAAGSTEIRVSCIDTAKYYFAASEIDSQLVVGKR